MRCHAVWLAMCSKVNPKILVKLANYLGCCAFLSSYPCSSLSVPLIWGQILDKEGGTVTTVSSQRIFWLTILLSLSHRMLCIVHWFGNFQFRPRYSPPYFLIYELPARISSRSQIVKHCFATFHKLLSLNRPFYLCILAFVSLNWLDVVGHGVVVWSSGMLLTFRWVLDCHGQDRSNSDDSAEFCRHNVLMTSLCTRL